MRQYDLNNKITLIGRGSNVCLTRFKAAQPTDPHMQYIYIYIYICACVYVCMYTRVHTLGHSTHRNSRYRCVGYLYCSSNLHCYPLPIVIVK